MPTYLIEVRDSDGNNCSVFDVLVTAPTREAASERLWKHLSEAYPNDESDGGSGTFHACDCHCSHRKRSICARCLDGWECSHGGLLTNEDREGKYGPQEYATASEARDALTHYHSVIDLTDDEEN